ncbi:AzlD domain-containing protein [Nakamurella sp. GG22]
MTVWVVVLLVGAGSYAFRLTPLLLGERLRLGERTQQGLRHAGMGGIAALLLAGVIGHGSSDPSGQAGIELATVLPTAAAVLVAAFVALRGRSMIMVLLTGGTLFAATSVGIALLG